MIPHDLEQLGLSLTRTQRLAGVGTLAASVAHELNNPISIIAASCSDLLMQAEEETLDAQTLQHHLEIIEQSAWRCARLIQTLRTYTHIDSSQVVCTTLNQIVEDGLTLVAYQFEREFNVEITTTLADGLQPVYWEQNQITQVLINLLTNARDALGATGGKIEIRSWALPEQAGVAFSVHDSGRGIPEEFLERVFEPFFTSKAAGEGTGLGLSIARAIVEQHQGHIWAENHPEGGAVFTVVLPYEPETEDELRRPK